MRTAITISKRLVGITEENLWSDKRILNLNHAKAVVWKGAKRYAH